MKITTKLTAICAALVLTVAAALSGMMLWQVREQSYNSLEQHTQEKLNNLVSSFADLLTSDFFAIESSHAEACGHSIWECKIGRTDKDPLQRIFGQAGTCYPELPHIALIIKCSNSLQLEAALHNILKLRNRWIENAPGTEWFLTSPAEIESVYHIIVGE